MSVIACPRCRAEWADIDWAALSARIRWDRWEWPIDYRRRYRHVDIDDMRPVPCEACGVPLAVNWVEVTEPRNKHQHRRPDRVWCRPCEDEEQGSVAA